MGTRHTRLYAYPQNRCFSSSHIVNVVTLVTLVSVVLSLLSLWSCHSCHCGLVTLFTLFTLFTLVTLVTLVLLLSLFSRSHYTVVHTVLTNPILFDKAINLKLAKLSKSPTYILPSTTSRLTI